MSFRDMKLQAKLLFGFGIVVMFIAALAVFAFVALNSTSSSYRNKLEYSQQRVRATLEMRYDVMYLQRITYAINADIGDTSRLNTHEADASSAITDLRALVARYTELANNDTAIKRDQRDQMINKAAAFLAEVENYNRDMIVENLKHARADNAEALTANYNSRIGMVTQIEAVMTEMYNYENTITSDLLEKTNSEASMYLTIFVAVAVVIAIISILLALLIAGSITKPITKFVSWMVTAAKGDIVWAKDELDYLNVHKDRKDEIGTLMRSYAELLDYMGVISTKLSRVAEGDLDISIQPASDKDQLAHSLSKMIEDLNRMFGEIHSGSMQVNSGSQQISDGAQSLAQGSTEQAATVEQLSASIAEIATKTKGSADLAKEAAALSNTIMRNAETGNRHMDEMVSAVNEINRSSQEISKVIKVIDDIAFQTNILALNAAVEAARAGQHGKGFAVVAEEVRNLAAKSAEAAKNTGGLIANSMQKAELGASIASETAASLSEIVHGINDSTSLINNIAMGSEEQSSAIAQINDGIDQVANVVQQNSATAEQSAALAEELSGQSDMLSGLIAKFKLRNMR